MAKYKKIDGSILNGKIGGLVYKSNANGHYVQPYRKKVSRPVYSQQYTQAFETLASHWRSLTDAERYTWQAAVTLYPKTSKTGNVKILTPKQLFMSHCAILMTYCGYDIDTIPRNCPPPSGIIGVSRVFTNIASATLQILEFNVTFMNGLTFVPNDHVLVIYASLPWSAAYPYTPTLNTKIFTTMNPGASPLGTNLFADYGAQFIPLQGNEVIYMNFKTINRVTGEVGTSVLHKIYVTP